MSEYFPEPKSLGGRVKIELDLSNYAKKVDLKNVTGIDTSKFAKKVDLANLNFNIEKLYIDKVENVLTNLSSFKNNISKLRNIVKNDAVKRDVYNSKIKNIDDKIPDITNSATNASANAKVNEVKGEIPNFTNLATTIALTAVECSVSNLAKKTDYNTKINEIEKKITDHNHEKYITTPEFNKFPAESFALRLKRAKVISLIS